MKFRLSNVLRARSAQERIAQAELLAARKEAAEAAERTRRMDEAIGARPKPEGPNGLAFAATMWARQAMATELAAAVMMQGTADDTVRDREDNLTAAAMRRRTVEKLGERHAAAVRAHEEALAQLEADDLTSSRNRGGTTDR
jgi:flagellar protein FliJ